jgi:hypothetical protein
MLNLPVHKATTRLLRVNILVACILLQRDILKKKVLRVALKMETEYGTFLEHTEGEKRNTEKIETHQNSRPI